MDEDRSNHPKVTSVRNTQCPLVDKLLPQCYCSTPKSTNIYSIIYYCGNNFGECSIYRKHQEAGASQHIHDVITTGGK